MIHSISSAPVICNIYIQTRLAPGIEHVSVLRGDTNSIH